MDREPAAFAGLKPVIPADGLAEALEGWSSKGELWRGLAAVPADRDWSWRDTERRAMRVLLEQLAEPLASWPTGVLPWLEALPAAAVRTREVMGRPGSGTAWAATRAHGSWPPRRYVARPKQRIADQLLVTTLRWVAERLLDVQAKAIGSYAEAAPGVRRQLAVLGELLDQEPVASAPAVAPTTVDLAAIAAEGRPWVGLADIAGRLLALDDASALELARRLIAPTEESWRLFHLAVLGRMLGELRRAGWAYESLKPLSGSSSGPAFSVDDPRGGRWELWFEAAGAWSYHGLADPYADAAAGTPGAGSALGCDIALLQPGGRALLIDCKYSPYGSVVGRDGYRAALAYAAEAVSGGLAAQVISVAVGPDDVVGAAGWTDTAVGRVGVIGARDTSALVGELLSVEPRHGSSPPTSLTHTA